MINYLRAHRATIIALVGVTLTYLSAKYGTGSGNVQTALQIAIPIAAVLGVHVSPGINVTTYLAPSPQAKHAATTSAPSPAPAPVPPSPPTSLLTAPVYIPAPTPPPVITIDTNVG